MVQEDYPVVMETPTVTAESFGLDSPAPDYSQSSGPDFGWLDTVADKIGELFGWLGSESHIPIWLVLLMLFAMLAAWSSSRNKNDLLDESYNDWEFLDEKLEEHKKVLARIDPDLVAQARFEVEHPELAGRVRVGNFNHPVEAMRPDQV